MVWRCISRLAYGTKYCKHSAIINEEILKQTILAAVNRVMVSRGDLKDQLISALRQEMLPISGEALSISDIDRALEDLSSRSDQLLRRTAISRWFGKCGAIPPHLHCHDRIEGAQDTGGEAPPGNKQVCRRTKAAEAVLTGVAAEITEWKEDLYQPLEKVTVLDEARIKVTFHSGVEIEQTLEKGERSVTA